MSQYACSKRTTGDQKFDMSGLFWAIIGNMKCQRDGHHRRNVKKSALQAEYDDINNQNEKNENMKMGMRVNMKMKITNFWGSATQIWIALAESIMNLVSNLKISQVSTKIGSEHV